MSDISLYLWLIKTMKTNSFFFMFFWNCGGYLCEPAQLPLHKKTGQFSSATGVSSLRLIITLQYFGVVILITGSTQGRERSTGIGNLWFMVYGATTIGEYWYYLLWINWTLLFYGELTFICHVHDRLKAKSAVYFWIVLSAICMISKCLHHTDLAF